MSKLVDKLVGKKSNAKVDDCASTTKECKPKSCKIYAVLNHDNTWNEELKKYIFVDPNNTAKVVVTDYTKVEFEESETYWRFTDALYSGVFDSLTMIRVQ